MPAAADGLASGRRSRSLRSPGRRSLMDLWQQESDKFSRGGRREEDDEEELLWAAIERLPTYDRIGRSVLKEVLDDGTVKASEVDVKKLTIAEWRHLQTLLLHAVEEEHETFLRRQRMRADRVGIEMPKIEIRYEHLAVEGDVHFGSRALPTLINTAINSIESVLGLMKLAPSKKRKIQILKDASGIIQPSRMVLLLGPPRAGKTTFLLSLAGKLDHNLRKSGKITYCGHEFNEFVPQKTCAYISQHDLHHGEMTVRETLDFSARCLGVGSRYELLAELSRREKEAGIKPDPEIDAIMKATSIPGQKTNLVTDYVLKILGLDVCSDILVGDEMRRGISGGQKKRLTTGEMLAGPTKAFFMDEISTGLDTSTTFQIVKYMRQIVHVMDVTMIISLLQPSPETYNLFDDVILLSEGHIVYQGPRESVLQFFEHMGFKCPERKGVADFLQEVTSKQDQEQYWYRKEEPYRHISASEFAKAFNSFHIGQHLAEELSVPYDKSKVHPAALVKEKYGIPPWELFRACFSREWLLMKRNSFIYIFKTVQITFMSLIALTVFFRTEMPYGKLTDGGKYFGALFFSLLNLMFNGVAELALTVIRLPVFFKQRDFYFYPAWTFCLPIWILRIPLSIMESTIWIVLTYYTIGFAPSAGRFFGQFLTFFSINQMALGLFRFIAALGRTQVVAHTLGTFSLFVIFVLGGFIVSKNDLKPWIKWTYYFSPLSYGQNAIVMNEFLDKRWSSPNTDPRFNETTVGKVLLQSRGFFTEEHWFWICCFALLGFSVLFNILFIVALTFLNPLGDSNGLTLDDDDDDSTKKANSSGLNSLGTSEGVNEGIQQTSSYGIAGTVDHTHEKGMILPFKPLSLVFDRINYYVDMPAEMKAHGVEGDRLQLLRDISGAFRPGVLTALVGVSGAGKTTLMDVLAGRKTSGYIEGSINISGYTKNQSTFARISGYCEQNDIHSPNVTVYESVLYSAWLRLTAEVKKDTRKMFVEEVMELVELNPIRNSIVGLPAVYGLSTEQRKRLTIAVELVANPSIIFMDEPTSGLDARAAAIVMRTVRNTVDTGRTVVCTIHQPSIDIFEAFDELLLMTRGGRLIYAGALGRRSQKLIEYFEAIPGVPKIKDGYNPATWMLDISTPAAESEVGVDFAEIYSKSSLYQRNQELINELSSPAPDSKDLHFPTKHSQSFLEQCKACFWKQYWSYWRNTEYNAVRLLMTVLIGLVFGLIFWNKGQETKKQQDLQNLLGAIYAAVLFLGTTNGISVLDVVCVERTVLYREMAAGMYSAFPYAFAQVAIETIYVAIQTIIYTLLLYSMIGFDWTVSKFFMFYYFIFTSFIYFTLFGMMFIALTPGLQVGAIVSSFFHSLWNLFSGFLLSRMQIPVWWRWYYWGSPVAWTIYGIVASQFGNLDSEIEVPGMSSVSVKTFLKQNLGFDHHFLPVVVVMHLFFILLFVIIFAFGIKYLNYQKR
ncbi:pleiotropic drug resistance 6 [Perilla frutescens var. hirtella]|nr:pleiotropic drug resistance 6 [Perilla frutescens var. hirtella]